MIFNLANEYEHDKYKEYVNALYKKRAIVKVEEKKKKRTLRQNAYLHVILSYFACEYGCSQSDAKYKYYKMTCNRDIYIEKVVNKYGKEVERTKSSTELTTAEMTTSIERFRNWAATGGYYLPAPHESEFLVHCQQVIEQNKDFVEQEEL